MTDETIFAQLALRHNQRDEEAADNKALVLLKNSPYKDKLGNAGLFLRALAANSTPMPNLVGPHLGNRLAQGSQSLRMADLIGSAPQLQPTQVDQIAAVPLGARIKVNPRNDTLEMMKTKPVALVSPSEKMPFRVTPLFLYLTRFGEPEQRSPVHITGLIAPSH
jgi:hypothetical protein